VNGRLCKAAGLAGGKLCTSGAGYVVVLCLCLLTRWGAAQSVLAPPPPFAVIPPAMLEFQTNRTGALLPPETAVPEQPPLQWGPVGLRPHVFYRLLYGDGIPSSPSNRLVTAINEISPGLLMNLGSHWALDYTPTWRFYSNKAFRDTLDHLVVLTGGVAYEDWVLGLSQSYLNTSQPLVETGTQTTQETYITDLTGSYRFNSKMSTDLALEQTFASADEFTGYHGWVSPDWVNYQFWPRLDAGVGLAIGYLAPDTGPDMLYEQYQARVRWRVADKTSVQLRGGLDDRQFLGGGASDLLNPVFGAVLEYHPFDPTIVSLSGERTIDASYFANQITENSTVRLALSQRLLEKLHLNLSGAYSRVDYVSSTASATADRHDNVYFFDARLSWSILKRGTASVVYQHTEDSSNQSGLYNVSSDQVGLELGYRY
jgi:hypothetical protein